MTILIHLHESTIAMSGETVVDTRKGKSYKDPIGPLARLMISNGANPDELVHVVRDSSPVFKRDSPLGKWAGEDWRDSQEKGPHRVKWALFSAKDVWPRADNDNDEADLSEVAA